MTQSFRFIQASDLHIDRPPGGLAEVPDSLRTTLVDAPYRAAERVFDAALKERVDFVLLAGDVIDPLSSGPRGLVFLSDQFQRLAAQAIRVYWAGGQSDDFERWADVWTLGDNVLRFPSHHVQRVVHSRDGHPLAQIIGTSAQQRAKIGTADFHTDGSQLFSVAVAHGLADAEVLARQAVTYWALGGRHDRGTLLSGPITAHYCGTTQGRRPDEPGPRGCTLVQVDESSRVRTSFISTDAVRYQLERVTVNDSTTSEQLQQIVGERMGELAGDPFGPDLLIHWTITGSQPLFAELRRGKLAGEMTTRLRAEFGAARPAAWTVAVDADLAGDLPDDLYDQDTVLGEYLRTVRQYVEHPEEELSLEPYLTQRHLAGSLGEAVAFDGPATRRRALAEVARLGRELLSPQESRP